MFLCVYKSALSGVYDILPSKQNSKYNESPYIINKNNATSDGRASRAERGYFRVALELPIATCSIEENVVYYTKKICLGMMGFPHEFVETGREVSTLSGKKNV